MNYFEIINENSLKSEFSWINEPLEWSYKNEELTINAFKNTDFFIDEEGTVPRKSAPFLYKGIDGDFVFEGHVSVNMKEAYDSGCLMVMFDEQNWAKLCLEKWNGKPSIVSVVTKEYSDDALSKELDRENIFLKIVRANNCFGFFYSEDGINWNIVRYFNMKSNKIAKVGVVAQCPLGDSTEATFSKLSLRTEKSKIKAE